MRRDVERLDDILAAADEVMEFCDGLEREEFERNKTVR